VLFRYFNLCFEHKIYIHILSDVLLSYILQTDIHVNITEDRLDLEKLTNFVTSPSCGAVSVFIGTIYLYWTFIWQAFSFSLLCPCQKTSGTLSCSHVCKAIRMSILHSVCWKTLVHINWKVKLKVAHVSYEH
jgi:hypothetical protein